MIELSVVSAPIHYTLEALDGAARRESQMGKETKCGVQGWCDGVNQGCKASTRKLLE